MDKHGKKLYRSRHDRIILGVAGGLGQYFDFDPTLFRIIFIILAFNGLGILIYIILAFIMPLEPEAGSHTQGVHEGVAGALGGSSSSNNQSSASGQSFSQSAASASDGEHQGINGEKLKEFAEDLGQRTREMADEFRQHGGMGSGRNVLGLIIVIVGIALLLRQFFPFYFYWLNWGLFWPLVLVAIGAMIMLRNKK